MMLEVQVGGIIRNNFWPAASWVLVLAFLLTGNAYGQALDLSFDLNTPAASAPQFSDAESLEVNAGLGFSLGYFSRPAFSDGPPLRMGVIVGRQQLSVSSSGGTARAAEYVAFRVQGRADFRLWGNKNFYLSGGLALGLSFMSDNNPCNEIFCDLPSSVVLVTPSLRATGRISSKISGILEFRGSVYMTDHNATFPYRSGVIVAVGIEFFTESSNRDELSSDSDRGDF